MARLSLLRKEKFSHLSVCQILTMVRPRIPGGRPVPRSRAAEFGPPGCLWSDSGSNPASSPQGPIFGPENRPIALYSPSGLA